MAAHPTLPRASSRPAGPIPARAGVGLKPAHFADLVAPDARRPAWVEVHPDNYMGAGGAPHRWLSAVRELVPLSFHSVGLSLGSADGVDLDQLELLAALAERYEPALVSDHLSWSAAGSMFLHDLLPLPLTSETLAGMATQVDAVQTRLRRQILIENPATYLRFVGNDYDEPGFITELCRRTGCRWLLDINNVVVSCGNHQEDAAVYMAGVDPGLVDEIHLAGHVTQRHPTGLWRIDDHGSPVEAEVWQLYENFLRRSGPCPTLIERDTNLPGWADLMAEAEHADLLLAFAAREADHVA